jgi:hypothetical protein
MCDLLCLFLYKPHQSSSSGIAYQPSDQSPRTAVSILHGGFTVGDNKIAKAQKVSRKAVDPQGCQSSNKTTSEVLSRPFKHRLFYRKHFLKSFQVCPNHVVVKFPSSLDTSSNSAIALSTPNSTVPRPDTPYPAIRPEQLRCRCHQILLLPAQRCRFSHPRHHGLVLNHTQYAKISLLT